VPHSRWDMYIFFRATPLTQMVVTVSLFLFLFLLYFKSTGAICLTLKCNKHFYQMFCLLVCGNQLLWHWNNSKEFQRKNYQMSYKRRSGTICQPCRQMVGCSASEVGFCHVIIRTLSIKIRESSQVSGFFSSKKTWGCLQWLIVFETWLCIFHNITSLSTKIS